MSIPDFQDACDEIAPRVLKALLYLSVKRLECIRDTPHPTLIDFYKVEECDLIYKALPLLQGLKELRLGLANRTDEMRLEVEGFRNTLEEFSSRSCWDTDVETLANNCKRLRCLDISGSPNITDRVVDHILKFEHLEELNLCEVTLSESGLQHIFNFLTDVQMSQSKDFQTYSEEVPICSKDMPTDTEDSSMDTAASKALRSELLKSFGCNNAAEQHIDILAQNFSNLRSLALSNVRKFPLTPLRALKHLETLTLKGSFFSLVRDLLMQTGDQLKCLNIVDVVGTDFKFISERCSSLLCLHLCFEERENLVLPDNYQHPDSDALPLPNFPTVIRLHLRITEYRASEYILTRFRNLKNLFMEHTFEEEVLDMIMKRNIMIQLEYLFWGDDASVQFSGLSADTTTFHYDGSTSVMRTRVW
jgi:hypothetical protein